MNPTERFTSRVSDYARYRPGYPEELVDWLENEAGLARRGQVVDVGAGTGISAELFLRRGYRVTAVEPNAAMRAEAMRRLGDVPGFAAVDATGERTGLPNGYADMVLCAQAFHWLDGAAAAQEFRRVIRPGGLITVLWNERRTTGEGLEQGLEELLKDCSEEYRERVFKRTRTTVATLPGLFGNLRRESFVHEQVFDWEGLKGRMASASYVPLPGEARHEEFMRRLRELYDTHNRNGEVTVVYDCEVYCAVAASRL